jgi:hypothetical protein
MGLRLGWQQAVGVIRVELFLRIVFRLEREEVIMRSRQIHFGLSGLFLQDIPVT